MAMHPELALSLNLGSRPVDLMKDEADLAIRIGPPGSDSLVARLLSRETIILCASPTYLARSGPLDHPEDLAPHRILHFTAEPRLELIGPKGTKDLTITPVLRSNEPEILIQAARQHVGVAVVSRSFIGESLASGELVRVLPEWSLPTRDVNALYAPGRGQSPKVRVFLDFLVEALKAEPTVLSI